jgi:hypothetical protein
MRWDVARELDRTHGVVHRVDKGDDLSKQLRALGVSTEDG